MQNLVHLFTTREHETSHELRKMKLILWHDLLSFLNNKCNSYVKEGRDVSSLNDVYPEFVSKLNLKFWAKQCKKPIKSINFGSEIVIFKKLAKSWIMVFKKKSIHAKTCLKTEKLRIWVKSWKENVHESWKVIENSACFHIISFFETE